MSKVVFTFSSLRSVFRCSAAVRASYGLASNIRKLWRHAHLKSRLLPSFNFRLKFRTNHKYASDGAIITAEFPRKLQIK